ncbi:MAG TPA: 3-oxoacyl-ACP synthase [Gemmatimonadetes bacterium]|jgi:3-oxoacyl-[acyl-carrier-protein] synthase-3|nr:beta-ketoacyl-ACP synthase III [Gemmatimonadota bacterium]HAY76407.1 3-oxoacyl-ACP synthase [Gemmatimonadota bacterium]
MKTPTPIAEITGTGRFLPDNVVTNLDLERSLDTSDEWIRTRTGIHERRIAPDDMHAAHLGAEAARGALEEAGVQPGDVDILIISTATPDRWLPSTACDVQAILGCDKAVAFDVMAACTGHLYALSMAEGYIAAGRARVALVVAAEKMSAIVDWTDRKTAVLFGDGGGAAVLQPSNGSGRGILSSHLQSDGNLANLLYRPGGGAVDPISQSMLDEGRHLLRMNGREIFKNAVRSMAEACDIAIEKAGLGAEDVDLLVPHQANIRIIEATAKYAGVPMDKVFVNVDKYGNMSSATVPIAFDEAREQGRIREGSNVVTVAFGAGLTWGAMAIRM